MWYCWNSKGALQLGFTQTEKPFCNTTEAERAFLIQGMHIFYWWKKNLKNCEVGRILLFLQRGRKHYVFMKYQLIREAGQNIFHFALLVSVAWCNLYKINSHLKMLGSCWVEVQGRRREMSSGGPARWSLVKGGHLLGPSPVPKAQSLSHSSAGPSLTEMARDFQGANSWLEKSFHQKQAILAGYIEVFF